MKMKLRKHAQALIVAAVMGLVSPATANTLTFQGVTFETQASGNLLTLTITNALTGGTGNWANIQYLKAFEIKDIGGGSVGATGASISSPSINPNINPWSVSVNNGLSANAGCTTGGTPGACFFQSSGALALTDLLTFTLAFQGNNLNFSAPTLKVQFFTNPNDTKATGDLLSRTIPIPAIPEPEIYAMMAIGLGVLGWAGRRKKSKEGVAG